MSDDDVFTIEMLDEVLRRVKEMKPTMPPVVCPQCGKEYYWFLWEDNQWTVTCDPGRTARCSACEAGCSLRSERGTAPSSEE